LAASALDAYGCFFQGKFIFDNEKDKNRAKQMGIGDFEKKYELNEIVSGDSIFCATGVTSGDLVKGIIVNENNYVSETLITHKSSGLKKIYKSTNKI
jgi:fructose-1,6-bisphosphatase II / sedoheptulose-1,7-bisphosphatase